MMKEDDDNIIEVHDDRKQRIKDNFQKESGTTGTSKNRDKVCLTIVTCKDLTDKGRV